MAVTTSVVEFQRTYPEFADAPDALVLAKLTEARTLCPERVWGELTKMGIYLYTAQLLYDSPYARNMARVDQGGDREGVRSDASPYAGRLRTLKQTVASGWRVA